MEQRNEPTTAEIVKALRCEGDVDKCKDCYFANTEPGCVLCSNQEIESLAADRLESQEWEIERLQGEMFANALESAERIAALTARAEQAERERDALVKSVDRLVEAWENFKSPALIELVKQWRGQPQDGEGL